MNAAVALRILSPVASVALLAGLNTAQLPDGASVFVTGVRTNYRLNKSLAAPQVGAVSPADGSPGVWTPEGAGGSGSPLVLPMYSLINTAARWGFTATWVQTDVTSAGALQFEVFPRPVGKTIRHIIAYLMGAAGHVALPGTLPTIALSSYSYTTGPTNSSIGTVSDPSGTTGAYQALHAVTLDVNEYVDDVHHYYVVVTGETGSNAGAGLILTGIDAIVD